MTEPTEMERRVAKAIYNFYGDDKLPLGVARAAIRAMRTPSVEMVAEMENIDGPYSRGHISPHDYWQAMIDAASPAQAGADSPET